jgi:hypothetical protein
VSAGVACIDCRHFQQTGMQNSGILLPDKSGPWFYEVGDCTLATENTRAGRLAVPTVDNPRVVSWGSCPNARALDCPIIAGRLPACNRECGDAAGDCS